MASVYVETRDFLAVYNIAPILPGHSLAIPRRHVRSVLDLTEPELHRFAVFSRRVTAILNAAFGTTECNWAIQDGPAAGQTVPHLHLHIIPRRTGDLREPGDWYPELQKRQLDPLSGPAHPRLDPEQMQAIVARLRAVAARLEG